MLDLPLQGWSFSRAILQPKNSFFKPQSFGFPPPFPTKGWEAFYWLISYLFSGLSQAVLQGLLFKAVRQGLSFNAAFFREVGFPPQSPIGLGGFSSTRLPPSHALRVEFSKLPNRSHPTWVRSCLSPWGYSKKVLFLTLQGVGFLPQFPAGLRDFLLTAVYQTIIFIFRFPLFSSLLG